MEIGDGSIIREYCTIHRGTSDRQITKIGSNCLLMAYSHIAHDSFLKNHVILSNNVHISEQYLWDYLQRPGILFDEGCNIIIFDYNKFVCHRDFF